MVITNKDTSKDTLHLISTIHFLFHSLFSTAIHVQLTSSRKNPRLFHAGYFRSVKLLFMCAISLLLLCRKKTNQRNIGFEKTDPNTAKKYTRMMTSCLESCAHNCIYLALIRLCLLPCLMCSIEHHLLIMICCGQWLWWIMINLYHKILYCTCMSPLDYYLLCPPSKNNNFNQCCFPVWNPVIFWKKYRIKNGIKCITINHKVTF